VTTIPLEIASAVACACEEFVCAEAVVLGYLEAGDVTAAGISEATAQCRRMIDALREQVARKPQKTILKGRTQ